MVLACSRRYLKTSFFITWAPFCHPFRHLGRPNATREAKKRRSQDTQKMSTLNLPPKCEKEHPKGSNPDQIQTLFRSFWGSGNQPGPGWAPGPHFHRFWCPERQTAHEKHWKSRPQHAFVHAFFFLLSFLPVCFPSCFLCKLETNSAVNST